MKYMNKKMYEQLKQVYGNSIRDDGNLYNNSISSNYSNILKQI
jgi:hypothetical protein